MFKNLHCLVKWCVQGRQGPGEEAGGRDANHPAIINAAGSGV